MEGCPFFRGLRETGRLEALKDSITILRAGTAHSGRDGKKDRIAAQTLGTLSVHKPHMEINEKQSDQILKAESFGFQKAGLGVIIEIRERSQLANAGTDYKVLPPDHIMGVATS